ncbi:MAG: ABC transporter substrate-binding protein [Thermodesulfobacteriota bacterium]
MRRGICCVLAVVLVVALLAPLRGQAGEKVGPPLVVGVLLFSKNNQPALEALKAGLRERGYEEGRGIEYVFDGVVERAEDLEPAMARILARNPDLVYTAPTFAAHVAKKACLDRNIPVLFGPANNAVESGLVKDRKRPGENITGVVLSDNETKRLQWTVEMAPRIKNLLVPYNPEDKSARVSMKSAMAAAAKLGLSVIPKEVPDHAAIDALLGQWPSGIDSIFLPRDALVMSRVKDFADLAIREKLIISTGTRISYVEKGILLSYGFDDLEMGRQVARLAHLIFKGKKAGDLPVETAEDYLGVNLKTAEAIGMKVNQHILRSAHRLIRVE